MLAAYQYSIPTIFSPQRKQPHTFPLGRISRDSVHCLSTQLCKIPLNLQPHSPPYLHSLVPPGLPYMPTTSRAQSIMSSMMQYCCDPTITFSFSFCFVTSFYSCFCLCGKAWGIAGPPILSAIGCTVGQNPD
jgi:hypothetical protein